MSTYELHYHHDELWLKQAMMYRSEVISWIIEHWSFRDELLLKLALNHTQYDAPSILV
jgi:hypothetical protein